MSCNGQREPSPGSTRPHRALRAGDQALEAGREPPLGAHMVTVRHGYTHHGIYVGRECVVHYGGFSRGLRRGPVEEIPLKRFSQGRPTWLRTGDLGWKDRPEVVRRARSRLGENRYHLLKNNCEHFCEWCAQHQHRSYQVDELSGSLRRTWERMGGALARIALRVNVARANRSATADWGRLERLQW